MANIHKPPLKKGRVGKSALKTTKQNVSPRVSSLEVESPLLCSPLSTVSSRLSTKFCRRHFHRRCLLHQSLCLCRQRFRMSTKDSSLMMLTIKQRWNPRNKNQNSPLCWCPLVHWRSFCRWRLHCRCVLYRSLCLCRWQFRTSTKDLSLMMSTIVWRQNPRNKNQNRQRRILIGWLVSNQEQMPGVHPHHEPPRHSRRTNHFSP